MLQLKHLKLIRDLTGVEPHEIKAVKYGFAINYTVSAPYVLASIQIPQDTNLLVLRTQTYLTNQDEASSDYGYYRTYPDGKAWWILADDASTTALQDWTNINAPGQLILDSDEFLLFPPGYNANLIFEPVDAAPGTSSAWTIRTTIYAYFVPASVSDKLGNPQSWAAVI